MLTISPELAQAFEKATQSRWVTDIADQLRTRFPEATARFPGPALEAWVQDAMQTLSRHGAAKWPDYLLFVTTLFAATEGAPDDVATGDILAIMTSQASFPARMALLRKAFGQSEQD